MGRLPELTPGFHSGEPAATLADLGAARGDYLWLQAFDLLFVALAAMTALFAIALAERKIAAPLGTVRPFLIIPCAFTGAELAENSLLALFASGALSPSAPLAFVQQAATTVKLGLLALTLLLVFSFIAALGETRPIGRNLA